MNKVYLCIDKLISYAEKKLGLKPKDLDYAVNRAMCDGKGKAWTSGEKASARDRLGLEWKLLGEIEITEEASTVEFNGLEVNDIFICTKGLKTNKTSSMGCYLTLNNEVASTTDKLMYKENVFSSITTQEGFAYIFDIGDGYKCRMYTQKPDMELNTKQLTVHSSTFNQVGKINKVKLTSSEASAYPFTGGIIRLYGR